MSVAALLFSACFLLGGGEIGVFVRGDYFKDDGSGDSEDLVGLDARLGWVSDDLGDSVWGVDCADGDGAYVGRLFGCWDSDRGCVFFSEFAGGVFSAGEVDAVDSEGVADCGRVISCEPGWYFFPVRALVYLGIGGVVGGYGCGVLFGVLCWFICGCGVIWRGGCALCAGQRVLCVWSRLGEGCWVDASFLCCVVCLLCWLCSFPGVRSVVPSVTSSIVLFLVRKCTPVSFVVVTARKLSLSDISYVYSLCTSLDSPSSLGSGEAIHGTFAT